jgi:hypothetical protein
MKKDYIFSFNKLMYIVDGLFQASWQPHPYSLALSSVITTYWHIVAAGMNTNRQNTLKKAPCLSDILNNSTSLPASSC